MKIKVAAVQPRSHHGPEEERNVEQALSWMQRASEQGADLVVFPEGYPGPTNPASHYDSLGPLQEGSALTRRARGRRTDRADRRRPGTPRVPQPDR